MKWGIYMEIDNMLKKNKGKNLMDVAYNSIKELILENKLKPGDVLSENLIAQELGMSRTPVREALKVLAQEDFIEILKGIGTYVKDISTSDIIDIFEVRKSLEIIAIKTAIYEITDKEISILENKFINLKQKKDKGEKVELDEFTEIDRQLHWTIIEKCHNKYVKNLMKTINSNTQRYMRMSIIALNNLEESTNQHLELLNLIRKRDLENLTIALKKHIDWSLEWIIEDK